MKLDEKDLQIKGIFERFNEIIKNKEFDSMRKISIKIKKNYNSLKDIKIEIPPRSNCVLGSYRGITADNINAVNSFFKNYNKIE